jgi:hypothetical protein
MYTLTPSATHQQQLQRLQATNSLVAVIEIVNIKCAALERKPLTRPLASSNDNSMNVLDQLVIEH